MSVQRRHQRSAVLASVTTPSEARWRDRDVAMSSHQFLATDCRGRGRFARRHRGPSTLVRYTLLAPPSRLTPEEAAALLRIPRRAIRTEHDWFAPGLAETTGQPPLELRA